MSLLKKEEVIIKPKKEKKEGEELKFFFFFFKCTIIMIGILDLFYGLFGWGKKSERKTEMMKK